MTFEDVLTRAIAMLQRLGRVSYRALKRQFDIDDDYLEDLKDALFFAHPVVDEDGRGLVWTRVEAPSEPDAQHETGAESRFHLLLPDVTARLQQEGRITYRRLKFIYGVDDVLLEDLRKELTFQRVARDEQGEGLVWTGDTQLTETIAYPEAISTDGSSAEPAIAPAHNRNVSEAERRQLTVMFCDLADSTRLSQQLDPEDLRDVVRAYQATAAQVVEPYEGYVAQYLGDGLLIYFGWPAAHEDDAQRALHAGLGIIDAITGSLNSRLEREKGVQLTVRIGIHTGPVVVGEMGSGERHVNLATGETVNLAARLEGLAQPNTVVISHVTERLLRGAFALEAMGAHELKGIADPIAVFRVLGAIDDYRDAGESMADGGIFLVGRDEEVGLLLRRWEQTKEGLGQATLINGEAGIGKSFLVEALHRHVHAEGLPRITFRCSPYHQNSALYPVITHIEHLSQFERGDSPAVKLHKLEQVFQGYSLSLQDVVPLFAALLSIAIPEERYPALQLTPQQQKQQTLQAGLSQLVAAEILYRRGRPPRATYIFKHALIQDAAYESMLKSTRQQHHQRIARILAQRFPEIAENQPELLAHHFTEARLPEQAIGYWHKAGQRAVERSANTEAITHLTTGVEMLNTQPEAPERDQKELDLMIALGPPLIAIKGYVSLEVEKVYNRAYELCRHVGKAEQRFSVLTGLRRFYQVRGELARACEIGEHLLALAQQRQDPTLLLEAYWSLAGAMFHLGKLVRVQQYLEQAVAIYKTQEPASQTIRHGTIPGIHCLGWLSRTLWMRGYADQALQRMHEALTLARQHNVPFTLGFTMGIAHQLRCDRREWSLILEDAESFSTLQTTQLYQNILKGYQALASVMQDKVPGGIASVREFLKNSDNYQMRPKLLACLAEAHAELGEVEAGLEALAEGFVLVEKMGSYVYEAELHRIKGELLRQADARQTEACFHHALEVARQQQAKSLELRAATSLARLWQWQGKRHEAYDLLAPVYNWFTEGFDTADLKDARALLDQLGS